MTARGAFAYTAFEGFFRGWNMNTVIVSGGTPLFGEVQIGGSKNAALPILFAGILTGEECVFTNLPRVSDVLHTLEILHFMGARIRFFENKDVSVDYRGIKPILPPARLTGGIRGSTYLLGAMLARFGEAGLACSGGCDFGERPIDQHLAGFSALGAQIEAGEHLQIRAPKGLCGCEITLKMPSVGATANLMLAACGAVGETVIRNAAAEPHVMALGEFLRAAGAHIEGIGTETVRVFGGFSLKGAAYHLLPDMIEAGTYLCAGVASAGKVTVRDVCPDHLAALQDHFFEMGVEMEKGKDWITAAAPQGYRNISVQTAPYPGFPTDLHPQLVSLFALGGRAQGKGRLRECIWRGRFRYTKGLLQMGADICLEGDSVFVTPSPLHRATLCSPDLRGGAALLLAALATKGESVITNAATLARGYEHPAEKLSALGAKIRAR